MLPVMVAAPTPASTSTTIPTVTNPARPTPRPSMVSALANLFVTRQWPIPHTLISDQAPPKQENVPIRKVTIPSVMEGSKSASNYCHAVPREIKQKVQTVMQYLCTNSCTPSPANPDQLEEDRGYYQPEPEYIPSYEEMIPILVTGEDGNKQQRKKEEERIEEYWMKMKV